MPLYKLKYRYWYVRANNAEQARAEAIKTIRNNAEALIDVELAKPKQRTPLWRMFLFGE
jgi:hypothetical protein